MPRPAQRNLFTGRANLVQLREETVQAQTVAVLTALGYRVFQTSVRYKHQACPKCTWKFRATGGYGATPGVPDLLVAHPDWPTAAGGPAWIPLEIKGTKTALSDEHKALHAAGLILLARTVDDAVRLVQEAERAIYGRVYGRTGTLG